MTDAVPETIALLTVVACALIDPQGRVLVQQRPAGTDMAGLWEFPGGKIEAGEAPEVALCRELREELAIGVEIRDVLPLAFASEPRGERHLLLLLFICHRWTGDVQPLHAAALRWTGLPELAELPMPPADVPLVDALRAYLAA
ncbi:NTP pyrophosphohydrolase [Sphingomonas sp. EC-HK361]|uniref:(deoxy)nucleoside triphosphate pyrophosphohydrolase n=1 Tax=Sphingomonas sp. EC-HK361 TaxID=2038397 RepID=UPI00125B8537|nr:(deoxy)nucleoside triphosphate pyrophosphohydrolase [Sphingomonas sp. EC-HK361]VVT10388.1 NTP pyrophosphohydrolase [Sphingomonas sp. EC-HK361]